MSDVTYCSCSNPASNGSRCDLKTLSGFATASKVTRSPIFAPSGGSISAPCSWSPVEAHSSMPFDGKPPSLRGFRLHRTHTRWPCISSKVWKARIPEPIWRGSASPTSTSSQYNLGMLTRFNKDTSRIRGGSTHG